MKVKLEFDLDIPTDNQEYMMLLKAPDVQEELKSKKQTLIIINNLVSDTKLTPSEKVERIYNLLQHGEQ